MTRPPIRRPIRRPRHGGHLAAPFLLAVLAACGGGGDDGDDETPPPPAGPTLAGRSAAAKATAESTSNACEPIRPFHWQVGDADAMLASGSVGTESSGAAVTAGTSMSIASASKWIYGTYTVQKRGGALTEADIRYLTFRSGYVSFSFCDRGATVQQCAEDGDNDVYTAAADGRFFYGGGHMQQHAAADGLGPLANDALAAEIRRMIGTEVALSYSQPQLAGGAVSTAADYARMLRGILAGRLLMRDALGTHATCTNPVTCATALATPLPTTESWSYSIGHWVETDPAVGDGAFSSAGAFGFYPWIDAGRQWYGIVAREALEVDAGYASAACGRLIRRAWISGVAS